MAITVLPDHSLDALVGSPELAEDIRASVHGGDCRVCFQPIPDGSTVRLAGDALGHGAVQVWAQHAACGQPTTTEALGGVMWVSPLTHLEASLCLPVPAPNPDGRPSRFPVPALMINPSIDGAFIRPLTSGAMPTRLIQAYHDKDFAPLDHVILTPTPAEHPDVTATATDDALTVTIDDELYRAAIGGPVIEALEHSPGVLVIVSFRHYIHPAIAQISMATLLDQEHTAALWVPLHH